MVRLKSASSEVVRGRALISLACAGSCRGYVRIERWRGHDVYGRVRFAHEEGTFTAAVVLKRNILRVLSEDGEIKVRVALDAVSGRRGEMRMGAVTLRTKSVGELGPPSPGLAWFRDIGATQREWSGPMPESQRVFAGYSVSDYSERDSMRSVQGVLTVPSIMTCPSEAEAIHVKDSGKSTATWVGLSGTSTVEQDGVYSMCAGNEPAYLPFVDMYPSPVYFVPMRVRPGEQVLTEMTQVSAVGALPQQFLATLRDLTTGAVFSQVFTQPTPGNTELVEWLTELQPSTWPTLSTLIWSNMSFSAMAGDVAAKSDELVGGYWEVREPVQGVCATPSALSPAHDSFTLAWTPCASMPEAPLQP